MVDSSNIKHLSKNDIVKNGSIFTPQYLVSIIKELLLPYLDSNSVIADFGSGYGAFLEQFCKLGKRCFATEYDEISYQLLLQEYNNIEIYNENSLLNISREKYNLSINDDLIIIGNPPYNDVTSQYKKGEKGNLICDDDVRAKDLGISFLKAYCNLGAKYVCVLHPLAYLIKKANFNALGVFKYNYRLLKGVVFSSKCFESINKTNAEFPVVAALYERNAFGMNFSFIEGFKFDIYDRQEKFCLLNINTIDGKVDKYPKKDHHNGLQFYTMRDINALLRNTSFVEGNVANGVEVPLSKLYQYAWILYFKDNFNPKNHRFLYGNLSPLYPKHITDDFKRACVSYGYYKHPLIPKYYSKKQIEEEYGILTADFSILQHELNNLYF